MTERTPPPAADELELLRGRFRDSFLDELPQRLQALEKDILALGPTRDWSEPELGRVLREAHNIKSSASTFGLYLVASICHQYEDYIAAVRRKADAGHGFVDTQLMFFDLIREARVALANGDEGLVRQIEDRLNDLRHRVFAQPRVALVATHARLTRAICREVLGRFGYQMVEAEDTFAALTRLTSEAFDAFIVSSELAPFNGEAAIAVVKLMPRAKRPLTILVTSNRGNLRKHHRQTDPDHTLELSPALPEALGAVLAATLKE
jgi:chemotaxis protein histidine kinase CheA